ncbi:MAG TPA: hypothetical protein VKQ08_07130 [Cyclobacteriaceae bacterium]|nr:hypothetical protein [Cyclobacteriaceae bacterium]
MRKENADFTRSILSPIPFYLAKYFPSLRADKQPVPIFMDNVTVSKIKNAIRPVGSIEASAKFTKAKAGPVLTDVGTLDRMLKVWMEDFSKEADKTLLREQLSLLSEYVTYLRAHGAKVYFFEMPVNRNLVNMPKARTIRQQVAESFPAPGVRYILPDTARYETTDGLHLNSGEAAKYTAYFKSAFKRSNDL